MDRTIHTSRWNPQIKAGLRLHRTTISVVYTGTHHDPVEKMIALYKLAHALQDENLLGIANENAWTAHPLADTLNPERILAYRETIPFALWMGTLKLFIDPEHYWLSTKGHHIFDVPDLAYFVQPGDQPDQIRNTFINIFYYLYEEDTEVAAGDTLIISSTGETMRFSEVTEFEDYLMGPAGTLVVEKIAPGEV
jgi:hypothetical protein